MSQGLGVGVEERAEKSLKLNDSNEKNPPLGSMAGKIESTPKPLNKSGVVELTVR